MKLKYSIPIVATMITITGASLIFFVPASAEQTGFLLPTADGTEDSSGWENKAGTTCNSADCYAQIAETIGSSCNGESDGNGTYVFSDTLDARQTFRVDISSIPDGSTVTGVNITSCNQRQQGGASFQTVACIDGACQDFGTNITPTTGYDLNAQLHNINFTKSSGSVLEIGVKNTNNRGLRISKLRANITYAPPQETPPVSGGTRIVYQPPIISDIKIIKEDGVAIIEFKTNEPSDSWIYYGEYDYNLNKFLNKRNPSLTHAFSLPDIDLSRAHYFKIGAANQHGAKKESGTQTLDLAPSQLTNVKIAKLTTSSAEIIFETDENTDGKLRWGKTISLRNEAVSATVGKKHTVLLTNLAPKTLYRYRVEATDTHGNLKLGNIRSFITESDRVLTPAHPQNFHASTTNKKIVLTWQNPDDPYFAFVVLLKNTKEPGSHFDGDVVYSGSGEKIEIPYELGQVFGIYSVDRDGNFSDITTESPDDNTASELFFEGAKNENVAKIQARLQMLGHFPAQRIPTGLFGPVTADAVKKFQQSINAKPNGILTSAEYALLFRDVENIPKYNITQEQRRGEKGDHILNLQRFLQNFGYIPFDGEPTGYFGPLTEKAVLEFQKQHKLVKTGRIDRPTIDKINSLISSLQ